MATSASPTDGSLFLYKLEVLLVLITVILEATELCERPCCFRFQLRLGFVFAGDSLFVRGEATGEEAPAGVGELGDDGALDDFRALGEFGTSTN
jgi:hypothetical protein